MGTGSAFKDGGLQGDGLKAVLATAVVFGRACGAASTTSSDSRMTPKWSQKWSQNGVCECLVSVYLYYSEIELPCR